MSDVMSYDVIIVGAGPAGLSAAIKLKQLALSHNQHINICILEKGAQVGSHIISGAVLEPRSLIELLGDQWTNAPLSTQVTADKFYYLTKQHAFRLPTPKPMRNEGNFIISLGELCQFLAKEAERLGCEIYPGFAASKILYDTKGAVMGVSTGDVGIDKKGHQTPNFQPGMHLYATWTLFAEGCRGELSQQVMHKFQLRSKAQPQTYALGIKEIWQIPPTHHQQGLVTHSIGWPLDNKTYGGSFMYHLPNHQLSIGFVVGLDYQNTWQSPFEDMQRFKTHPFVAKHLSGGERIAYGARALNEGGFQSLPELTFPGGALIGDAAGFLNVPKIKGIHTAMASGLLAAKACFDTLNNPQRERMDLSSYAKTFQTSWVANELYQVRNVRPGFQYGLFMGLANAAFETYLSHGHVPWTLSNHADHLTLKRTPLSKKINYPKPDGVLTFDRLSSVYLSNTFHDENQPCHLKLKDPKLAIDVNDKLFASPETRYCPAAVYEILQEATGPKLQINAQNCIHCKTCDIKDPEQNIVWSAPEGGGGPNYVGM